MKIFNLIAILLFLFACAKDESSSGGSLINTSNIKIELGRNHSCYINYDNSFPKRRVKCWGTGSSSLLMTNNDHFGDDTFEYIEDAPAIDLGSNFVPKEVYRGQYFTCVISTLDKLKCFGVNTSGQLGYEDTDFRGDQESDMGSNLFEVDLGSSRTALAQTNNYKMAMGIAHACIILDNNEVKCWGNNFHGQLGNDSVDNLGDNTSEMGDNLLNVDLGSNTAKAITAGAYHTCAILDDDSVLCWGYNNYGQLGQDDTVNIGDGVGTPMSGAGVVDLGVGISAKQIAAGSYHTCAILSNDSLKCWGFNGSGQLGQDSTTNAGDGIGIPMGTLAAINLSGKTPLKLYAHDQNTCVIFTDNSLRCWGDGSNGKLGNESTVNIGDGIGASMSSLTDINLGSGRTAIDVSMSNEGICVKLNNNQFKCWGSNTYGQLGLSHSKTLGPNSGDLSSPLTIIPLEKKQISQLKFYTTNGCAIFSDQKLRCWGYDNASGRIGWERDQGNTSNRSSKDYEMLLLEEAGNEVVDLKVGLDFACALYENEKIKCWGTGSYGKLGNESTLTVGSRPSDVLQMDYVNLGAGRTVKKITLGTYHACAILENDKVKCWGNGLNGRLGYDSINHLGDDVGEMGDSLPEVDLGAGYVAVEIAAGDDHTCAILDNDEVKCWGDNTYGKLGTESTTKIGDGVGTFMSSLTGVNLGSTASPVSLSLGSDHTCVLFEDGKAKCFGLGSYGRLGRGDTIPIGDSVGEMGESLIYVNVGYELNIMKISSGLAHTCMLLSNNKLKCYGSASQGQLGIGSTLYQGGTALSIGNRAKYADFGGPKVINFSTGSYHTCAYLSNDQIKCVGLNSSNQLGDNSGNNYGDNYFSNGKFIPEAKR